MILILNKMQINLQVYLCIQVINWETWTLEKGIKPTGFFFTGSNMKKSFINCEEPMQYFDVI